MSLFNMMFEEDIIREPGNQEVKIETISFRKENEDPYIPSDLDEFVIYQKEIEECRRWFGEYASRRVPKVLMIMGRKGSGKTLLANLLFKKFGYDIKEISHDISTRKQVIEMFKNAVSYHNLSEYSGVDGRGGKRSGFLCDDVELMLQTGDNLILNEIMTIIKDSKKIDLKREKGKGKGKGKGKKGEEEEEAAGKDKIPIYLSNPMICTSNYTNDKKMTELKKLCCVIHLESPSEADCNLLMAKCARLRGFSVEPGLEKKIYEFCEYDLRKINDCVENMLLLVANSQGTERALTEELFERYQLIYKKTDLNCSLDDGTEMIFTKRLAHDDITTLYDMDTLLLPLMVHHNMLKYIEHGTARNSFEEKMDIYEKSLVGLCQYDTIQTSIYKNHEWDFMPDISAAMSLAIPNHEFQRLKMSVNRRPKIEFTNMLNKISQFEVNKKMIQNALFSLNRLIIDEDEFIYLIEIFLNYLKIDRSEVEYEIEEVAADLPIEEEEEEKEDKKEKKKKAAPPRKKGQEPTNNDLSQSPYREIITVMNKYNIDLSHLETILKIEKLIIFENKNPKRLSNRMKDELQHFVVAQSAQDPL